MARSGEFRAGQRVRIRSSADSDFAGHYGVIMHVGGNVCDVRIRYKPRGSKVRSTYIGTFSKTDLESLRRPTDLALFEQRDWSRTRRKWWTLACVVVVLLVCLAIARVT